MTASATPGPVGALSEAAKRLVARALEAGNQAYGDHGLTQAGFEERVAWLGCAQAQRLGLPADGARLEAFVERGALADLCLASACEAGAASAWQVLHSRFAARLEGFAVKHGLCSPDAESLVQDVFGDLAGPPPRAATRTLLGTYDGSGSLIGWLSVVVLRRIAAQARRRKPQALDALEPAERDAARAPQSAAPAAPADALAASEQAQRFPPAFAAAFGALAPQQRLALVLKHRDGLSQREVGAVLGVGEARVSRVVSAALEQLVLRLQGTVDGELAHPDAWEPLARAVRSFLASCPLPHIPPAGSTGGSAGARRERPREGA